MSKWITEKQNNQQVLTHYCAASQPHDTGAILKQDIGGGYVRCPRCGDKFLPEMDMASPRLVMRLLPESEAPGVSGDSYITEEHFS